MPDTTKRTYSAENKPYHTVALIKALRKFIPDLQPDDIILWGLSYNLEVDTMKEDGGLNNYPVIKLSFPNQERRVFATAPVGMVVSCLASHINPGLFEDFEDYIRRVERVAKDVVDGIDYLGIEDATGFTAYDDEADWLNHPIRGEFLFNTLSAKGKEAQSAAAEQAMKDRAEREKDREERAAEYEVKDREKHALLVASGADVDPEYSPRKRWGSRI